MSNARSIVLTALLIPAWSLTATAQIPLGPEFRIDSIGADTGNMGDRPRSVSMAADGSFVVAWPTPPSAQGFDNDIAARRFNAAGRASGPDFIVNSYTTGFQENESVASDDAGNFVVVWDGPGADGLWDVSGQRFDAAGARIGAEFAVDAATASNAVKPFVAMRPAGEFVVAWQDHDGGNAFVRARRYDASGAPVGGDFQVNTDTSIQPDGISLDFDGAGNFVVVWGEFWSSSYQYQPVRARLFTGSGAPQGPEFLVNASTTTSNIRPRVARSPDGSFVVAWYAFNAGATVAARQFDPSGAPLGSDIDVGPARFSFAAALDVDADADGDFVIVWEDYYANAIRGRRFDSGGVGGPPFQADTDTFGLRPSVASDSAGNFVVVWRARLSPWPSVAVFARRYAGGLMGTALSVSDALGDLNGVVEAGEPVFVAPHWLNASSGPLNFTGTATSFSGPGAPGDPAYIIYDGAADYGLVLSGVTAPCTQSPTCYRVGIGFPTTRPALHWDATLREEIAPTNLGAAKNWTLHVGDSFTDVPRSNGFYRFVETMLHHNVTVGCTATTYCPAAPTTREQMAVFALVAKEGGYAPPACTTPVFNDVPASSPFCGWIEELARRGVVTGCGGGNYCPASTVSREEMAVFVLATKDPGVLPPACAAPMFGDVPASSPFCPWIEELARRGVVTGCGGGAYCPAAAVTREQMSVFLTGTFGLVLYGP